MQKTSFNDFEFIRTLGKGAFSTVYLVKRKADQKFYALKSIIMEKLKENEQQNSVNEIRILSSISHPNIIGFKESFFNEKNKTLNIVMEYCDDGDLETKIKNMKRNRQRFEDNKSKEDYDKLMDDYNNLVDDNDKLKQENDELKKNVDDNDKLKDDYNDLYNNYNNLMDQNNDLKDQIEKLREKNRLEIAKRIKNNLLNMINQHNKREGDNKDEEYNRLKDENLKVNEEKDKLKDEKNKVNEENDKLKDENANLNEENDKLKDENTNLNEENNKLKDENDKLKQLLDNLKSSKKDQAKNYVTEGRTLDYLRHPEQDEDKEDDNLSNKRKKQLFKVAKIYRDKQAKPEPEPEPVQKEIVITKVVEIKEEKDIGVDTKKEEEKEDKKIETKKEEDKNDRFTRALMKYRRNKEKKKEEDSGKKPTYKTEKSDKVMDIAKQLENKLSKQMSKSQEKDNRDDTPIITTKVDYDQPEINRAIRKSVKKKRSKKVFEDL